MMARKEEGRERKVEGEGVRERESVWYIAHSSIKLQGRDSQTSGHRCAFLVGFLLVTPGMDQVVSRCFVLRCSVTECREQGAGCRAQASVPCSL